MPCTGGAISESNDRAKWLYLAEEWEKLALMAAQKQSK
jgi:hypothetical protein